MINTGFCSFKGCARGAYSKGLCRAHYNQQHRGMQLQPIREQRPVVDGRKQCKTCRQWKPVSEYYKRSRPPGVKEAHGLQAECKPCMMERNRRNLAKKRQLVGAGV